MRYLLFCQLAVLGFTQLPGQDYEPWQPIDTLFGGELPGTFMYSENLGLDCWTKDN